MDWADLAVEELILAIPHIAMAECDWPNITDKLASALRKAKAEGYLKGAGETVVDCSASLLSAVLAGGEFDEKAALEKILRRAEQIEKGEAEQPA